MKNVANTQDEATSMTISSEGSGEGSAEFEQARAGFEVCSVSVIIIMRSDGGVTHCARDHDQLCGVVM
jgi:hypothetical protein